MKNRVVAFLALMLSVLFVMIIQKPVFMLIEPMYSHADLLSLWKVVSHGFSMDLSMTAYLISPVAIWLIVGVWIPNRIMGRILSGYLMIISALIATIVVLDAVLYPYWGFRLDATPIFYFTSSPTAAMASASWWIELLAIIIAGALSYGIYTAINKVWKKVYRTTKSKHRVATTACLVVLAGLLVIPIRGGVTVSTMSPGRSYFCDDMRLNHASVNPMYSLMYSLFHRDDIANQMHFFDDETAKRLYAELNSSYFGDSIPEVSINKNKPDVYLIILESFSAHLMPTLGGDSIAMRLDSIARNGILFTDCYAGSFRTDRALTTILSGYPAQPSTSLLRYVDKFGNLPSIAASLRENGYKTSYYYGGDINFTNLNAYLVATGYEKIIKDTDFPVVKRLSKWGVHDEYVFERALDDVVRLTDIEPEFRVIQTSSSHEPFEVPHKAFADIRKNAFAYADHCVGEFIDGLKRNDKWQNSVVVIVPDHWGAYPQDVSDEIDRHHIPLIITGGAINYPPVLIGYPTSQHDMAATLLALLNISSDDFTFSHNLLSSSSPHYAIFSEPGWIAIKTDKGLTVVQTDTGEIIKGNATDGDYVKAYFQTLYKDITNR